MTTVKLSEKERASIARAMRQGKRTRQTWQEEGRRIMAKYGGQWVAFFEGEIVAAARTASLLGRKLETLDVDRHDLSIRYVPHPTDRFVL